ncbi:MAG: SCO family protein [Actinomycetota bacterium]
MRKLVLPFAITLALVVPATSYAIQTPPLTGYAAKAGGTILDVPIPTALLSIPLTDANGKTFTLASLKGKIIVLTDFLTLCNEVCPMISVNMRDIGDAAAKAKLSKSITGLEITVDPKRDNPKRLKAYQSLFNDPSWTVATSTAAGLKSLWSWFGIYYKVQSPDDEMIDWMTGKKLTYDVDHTDAVVIIGPNLHWRWLDLGAPAINNPTAKNALPSALYKFLSPAGKVNLIKPEQPTWSTGAVYGALNEIFKIKIG